MAIRPAWQSARVGSAVTFRCSHIAECPDLLKWRHGRVTRDKSDVFVCVCTLFRVRMRACARVCPGLAWPDIKLYLLQPVVPLLPYTPT